MKISSAIIKGIVLWLLIFFEVSILMFGFGLSDGVVYYIIHYIFLVLFVILMSLWYFRGKGIRKGFGQGFMLGIIMVITGIILDSIITIPLWIIPAGGSYTGFLLNSYLLIGEAIVIVLSGIIGGLKR